MELSNLIKQNATFYEFVGYEKDVYVNLHNTATIEDALKIVEEGFRFVKNLDYTTDLMSLRLPEEIDYFIVKRKYYGNYTIVFNFGFDLMEKYLDKLRKSNVHEDKELIFSRLSNDKNEDDHPVNILDRQFIKGIYDQKTKEAYLSPYFAPHNDKPEFEECFQAMLTKNKI